MIYVGLWTFDMNEKMAKEKLHKNVQHVTGIAALRKIRILVDNFETQDKQNKNRSIVLFVITVFTFLCFIYYILYYEPSLININTSQADNVLGLIRFIFVLT